MPVSTLLKNHRLEASSPSLRFLLRKTVQGAQLLPVASICPPLWLGLPEEHHHLSFDSRPNQK